MTTTEKLAEITAQIRKDIPRIEGKEIILNDVLQWLGDNFAEWYYVNVDIYGDVSIRNRYTRKETSLNWYLPSPYLKDQSKELIEFLYNLLVKDYSNPM